MQSLPKPTASLCTESDVLHQLEGKSEATTSEDTSVVVNQPLDHLYVIMRQEREGFLKDHT
jgi:hypothetical protein